VLTLLAQVSGYIIRGHLEGFQCLQPLRDDGDLVGRMFPQVGPSGRLPLLVLE